MGAHCAIYKSRRQPDYYLFVEAVDDFTRVPERLLALLGRLEFVMELQLDEQRRLAQVSVLDVIRQLNREGYFLQMPPRQEADIQQ